MPDYEELLQKLLPLIKKETPAVVSGERAISKIAPSAIEPAAAEAPIVLGKGTSEATPAELPTQEADVATQQYSPNPEQASLSAPSTDLRSKWEKLKSISPYAGAAAAGTAAGVLSSQDGNPKAQAAQTAAQIAAQSTPQAQESGEEDEEDSEPTKPSAAMAKRDEEDSEPTKPYAPQPEAPETQNQFSVEGLRQAQEQANRQQGLANLARGMTNMAFVAGGRKENPFDQQFADQAKQAMQLPEQYLVQGASQKMDPKSNASLIARNLAKYIDPDLPVSDQMSASDLEKILPEVGLVKTREEATAARLDIAKQRAEMMSLQRDSQNTYKQQLQEQRQDQIDEKRKDTWAAKLALPSSRSALGQAKTQLYSIDRVQALLNGHPLNDINPQEAAEVYKGLDRVISGGSPTVQGSKSLDPDTARAGIARLMQQVTNQTQSAHAENFLTRINGNLNNEKEAARKTVLDLSNQLLGGGNEFYKRKPDDMRDFLTRQGLPPDMYDPEAQVESMKHAGPQASSNKSYANPAGPSIAKNLAAKLVQTTPGAPMTAPSTPAAPPAASQMPSMPTLQDAATAEIARRAALKAQPPQGNQ